MMMKTIATMSVGLACLIGTAVAADAPAPKPGAPKTEAPKAAEAPKTEAPKAPSPEAVAAGKKIDWATMDVAAKKKYMKATVLPTMKKLFVAFNKKTYSKMNRQTCHGEKGVENKFKMPNAELPKLPGRRIARGSWRWRRRSPRRRSSWGPR